MEIAATLCALTGASHAKRKQRIQSLWGGYGEIVRYRLTGADVPSVVVKVVRPPAVGPSDRSHARKLRSYVVEADWYTRWSPRCAPPCRVARALHVAEGLFVLEDLDAAGFPHRPRPLSDADLDACIRWLAAFHRTFLGDVPHGLWPTGTYWHLATRPDELARMAPGPLQDAAPALAAALQAAPFQTLVHGDAKVANFCLGDGDAAAVDFQYVGGGIGLVDLAYFLSSARSDAALDAHAEAWLARYFAALDRPDVEAAWRPLWPHAWADFERFMAGWSPAHHDRSGFAHRMTQRALASL